MLFLFVHLWQSKSCNGGEECRAHGSNFYGYGGQVQNVWYLNPTKVQIFKSILVSDFFLGLAQFSFSGKLRGSIGKIDHQCSNINQTESRIVTYNKILCFYRDIPNFCISFFIYIPTTDPLFYWSIQHRTV